jgi:hypothetical protein
MDGLKTAIPRINKMARNTYAPAERALHIIGALAGKTQKEINEAVGKGDILKLVPPHRKKEIPQGSLDMLSRRYAPVLIDWRENQKALWTDLWNHCVSPKKAGDL